MSPSHQHMVMGDGMHYTILIYLSAQMSATYWVCYMASDTVTGGT